MGQRAALRDPRATTATSSAPGPSTAGRHRSLTQLTWEDRHHLLGVLLAHGQWGLVRIGTDGTVEYAGPPVDATGEFTPYDLPLR